MFELFKGNSGIVNKKLLVAVGVTTTILIMVHYYHQIKLARLQIEESKRKLGKA